MAWSWSHTNEAYENARLNLCDLNHGDLQVIYSEWLASCSREEAPGGFNEDAFEVAMSISARMSDEHLIDYIWSHMSDESAGGRTCDNGGFNAWACPSGCHTVSFDRDAD